MIVNVVLCNNRYSVKLNFFCLSNSTLLHGFLHQIKSFCIQGARKLQSYIKRGKLNINFILGSCRGGPESDAVP